MKRGVAFCLLGEGQRRNIATPDPVTRTARDVGIAGINDESQTSELGPIPSPNKRNYTRRVANGEGVGYNPHDPITDRGEELVMSLPAARATDMQTCPAWNGPANPHVGGPIAQGAPTVLIGNLPAARLGDPTTCTGPPGTVTTGSPAVMIANQPAARVTDLAGHGGVISGPGCPTALIGGPAPPAPPPPPPEPEPENDDD